MTDTKKPFISVDVLDEAKPFADIYNHDQAKYAQSAGGHQFHYDAHKRMIEAMLSPEAKAWVEKRRAKAAADAAAEPVEETKAEAPAPVAPADPVVPHDDGEDAVNIQAWAKGLVRYQPQKLQKAFRDQFGVNKPTHAQMIQWLVEEKKLLSWEEVGPAFAHLRPAQQ